MLVLCISITALAICCAVGAWYARNFAREQGRVLNFGTLFIINYTLTQPISGLAHLLSPNAPNRGYYDLLKATPGETLSATAAAVFGMIGYILGYRLVYRRSKAAVLKKSSLWFDRRKQLIAVGLMILLFIPGWVGLMKMKSYATQAGLERLIVVDGGYARYAYTSQWLAWVISIGALIVAGRSKSIGQIWTVSMVFISVFLIALVVQWTGGRSILLLLSLPIIMVLRPRFRHIELPAMFLGAIGLLMYATVITQARLAGYVDVDLSYLRWLDWEGGRFSMSGFAVRQVAAHGLAWGETFANAVLWTLGGFVKLFGADVPDFGLRSSSAIAGNALLGSSDIYVVPGLTAELILNFGLIGVLLGYGLIGVALSCCDKSVSSSYNLYQRLAISFLGSMLVFRSIQADSASLPSYLIYVGSPLFICWGVSVMFGGRRRAAQGVTSRGIRLHI